MKEPTDKEFEAAERGALVPSVAYHKWKNGLPHNTEEQIFMWGYMYGYDDAIEILKRKTANGLLQLDI